MKNFILTILVVITYAWILGTETAYSSDETIFQAQQMLEELGYDPGKPDGLRGRKTVNAIKLFQRDNGLPETGKLDEKTLASLNANNAPPQFSLNEAVRLNDIVLVKALLDYGADVNTGDNLGETPLHVAVVRGYKDTASLLIERGADVNAGDVRGLTPVHAAAWGGQMDTVVLLISNGADINARDHDGLTPLHTAALAGRKETVELLIMKGADVNAKNKAGLTPLHAAALTGDRETVALLIKEGAYINARSDDGLTPLQLASQKGHPDVAELLRGHGSKEQ